MLIGIYGPPGAGKGCLQTSLIEDLYYKEGFDVYRNCCSAIDDYNLKNNRKLSKPSRVPFYSDFEVKFKVGYKKFYSTYFENGFYFGLENDRLPSMYVPPYSKVFLTEVQRYYDSRKSSSLPDFVSRLYEMHRHFHLDIYLDLQRLGLLDLNIRELLSKVIYIENLKVVKNKLDEVHHVEWICREFESAKDADAYIDNGANVGKVVTFYHEGDIFENYNSFSNEEKFIPDKYHDYVYMEHGEKNMFSEILMPEGYRNDKHKRNKRSGF